MVWVEQLIRVQLFYMFIVPYGGLKKRTGGWLSPPAFDPKLWGSSGLDIGVDADRNRLAVHRNFGGLVAVGRGNHQRFAGRRTNWGGIHGDSQNQKAVLDFRFHNYSKVKG